MKIFNYDIHVDLDNQWKQLEVFWNKEVVYNWYDVTVFEVSWLMWKKPSTDKLKYFREHFGYNLNSGAEIVVGFFGLAFTIYVDTVESKDENK